MEGPAVDQRPAESGGGGEGGGQAPQQMLRLAHPIGGQQGEQHAGQQKDRTYHPVDPLGPVVHLDLAAEAVGGSGPLAVSVPAVPFPLIQGENVGLGHRGRRAAAQAQAALFMVRPVEQEKQPRQNGGRVGQLSLPVLGDGQNQGVGQSKDSGQGGQGIHPHPSPEHPGDAGGQYIQGQQNPRPQQSRGNPNLHLIAVQRGQPHKSGGGYRQLKQGGGGQQKDQHDPQPHDLQPLAVLSGQLLGRGIRGRRLRPAGTAEASGEFLGFVLLHIGAGDQLLQAVDLLLVHLLRLLEHVVRIVVRLSGDVL